MKTTSKEKLLALITLLMSCAVTLVLATGILGLGRAGDVRLGADLWGRILL